jgi:hypothetical protein
MPPRSLGRSEALAVAPITTSLEAGVQEIKVITISAEETEHGVAELWAGGQQIAYTVYDLDSGELMLRIDARKDGEPLMLGVRELAEALAEVDRILAG